MSGKNLHIPTVEFPIAILMGLLLFHGKAAGPRASSSVAGGDGRWNGSTVRCGVVLLRLIHRRWFSLISTKKTENRPLGRFFLEKRQQ